MTNTWLNSAITDFLNKNQHFGQLTDKQISAFTKHMQLNKCQFYGRTHIVYTYKSEINGEIMILKIQGSRFTLESDSLNNKFEEFKNNNEIARCLSMMERLERDLQENPSDEKKLNMLNRKKTELAQLIK